LGRKKKTMFDTLKQGYLNRERENLSRKQAWKELAETCRKLLEFDAGDFKAMHDLIWALREQKDFKAALPWCDRIMKLAPARSVENTLALEGPRYLRYLVVSGEVFLRNGQLDRARKILILLKRTGGNFHKKHLLLSEVYEKQGRLAQAAAELEEMQEIYTSLNNHQWEHFILVRARELLPVAQQAKAADTVFLLYRLLTRISLRRGEIDRYIQARQADEELKQEVPPLKAAAALLQGKPDEVPALMQGAPWPELADQFVAHALAAQGKAAECAQLLRRMPVESPLRLELAQRIKSALSTDAAFLRDYAESSLKAGRPEEAFEAYQSLTTGASCDLADLERSKQLRLLLLDRNIWEDEARVGLIPGILAADAGRVARAEVEEIPLTLAGTPQPVATSQGFRFENSHSVPIDLTEVKLRLAENYFRRGAKTDVGVKLLQELGQQAGPMRARARCQLALHFIRAGNAVAAQAAFKEFTEAASAVGDEDRKRMLLDVGDCSEAAGLVEQAKTCYGTILAMDVTYADVQERARGLEKAAAAPKPAPAPEDAAASRIRQRFADLRPLGRGGMGVVYKAFDPLFARPVALKVLSERFRGDESVVARFLREGQAMAQLLHHPGIVRVYEVGAGHDMYIAMELVAGSSLRGVLKEKTKLPVAQVRDIALQALEALGFAHKSGIVHRDIKPDNLLLTPEGKVKLMDFGLADMSTATMLTQVGTMMGTGQYMPPEQIRGEEADARSDIYSFGAMLFELATGQVPFPKGDLAHRHINEAPPSPRTLVPDLPAVFEAAVLRCLEKDRLKRFQSCEELAAELGKVR
jgi:tetratricopeptide (TPR) repeat protein